MNVLSLLEIVVGVVVGYWLVSLLFRKRSPRDSGAEPGAAPTDADDSPSRARAEVPRRWYQVLDVPPSASPDEIRAAYRRLMSQYHPDKVSALGVELQVLAERKSKEIGAAYREGMNAAGVPP